MGTRTPRLFPIYRSESQARILSHLFLAHGGHSLREIAGATGLPLSTVHREVDRLDEAGIVSTSRVGGARIVSANTSSPVHDELRGLVLKTYGPPEIIARALEPVRGIESAYVFGSWAARAAGSAGGPPGDVDVLVVGTPSALEVDEACLRASKPLDREVNATVVGPDRWRRLDSGFLKTVSERPLLRILPRETE